MALDRRCRIPVFCFDLLCGIDCEGCGLLWFEMRDCSGSDGPSLILVARMYIYTYNKIKAMTAALVSKDHMLEWKDRAKSKLTLNYFMNYRILRICVFLDVQTLSPLRFLKLYLESIVGRDSTWCTKKFLLILVS
jgi:hypothetical protein